MKLPSTWIPEFEGQIMKYISPYDNQSILYEIATRNLEMGWLEVHDINSPTDKEKRDAFWRDEA